MSIVIPVLRFGWSFYTICCVNSHQAYRYIHHCLIALNEQLAVGGGIVTDLEHSCESAVLDSVPGGVRRVSWRPFVNSL